MSRKFSSCSDQVKVAFLKAYFRSFYTECLDIPRIRNTKRLLDALRIQYNILRTLLTEKKYEN